jgi:quercetin dioxygenase-like cupin family protein
MKGTRRTTLLALVIAAACGSLLTAAFDRAAFGQQNGMKRTILRRVPDPANPNYEIVLGISELAPGASSGRHRHPGTEIAYVLEGSMVIERDGGATPPLKAGDTLSNENDAVHNALNPGSTVTKTVSVYVVEKGKPLAESVR